MNVLVVNVREVRVPVGQHRMAMRMHMRFDAVLCEIMLVSVVGAMDMGVRMVQRLMGVIALMPLADVEPDADSHAARRHPEQAGHSTSEMSTPNSGATEK